ncbi:MAG: DegV family protein [Chloroflexota bacterium]|nr:DegV family protein [Chloroflexota bacterium]MDE2897630.1 DegV family protein [Chloroflexota bacterium]
MTATGRDRARHVRLITDSSACLPPQEIEAHGIAIVPAVLIWNGEELRDGVDITNEAFWKRLATDPNLPTTSATSPTAYAAEFAKARDAGQDVLCATIPRRISAMTEVAEVAARDFAGPPKVRVIQTGAATMAHGFPVLLGARAASAGADLDTVERTVREAADDSGIVALLGSLEYLARGGRVPWVVARVADALPSTPIFGMRHGRIRFRASFGSRSRALRALTKHVKRAARDASYLGVAVHHAAAAEEAHQLAEQIRRDMAPDDLYVTSFTPVMGTHVGPDLVGLAYCARSD